MRDPEAVPRIAEHRKTPSVFGSQRERNRAAGVTLGQSSPGGGDRLTRGGDRLTGVGRIVKIGGGRRLDGARQA